MEAPVFISSALSLAQGLRQGQRTPGALRESFALLGREVPFLESLHCFANMQKKTQTNPKTISIQRPAHALTEV